MRFRDDDRPEEAVRTACFDASDADDGRLGDEEALGLRSHVPRREVVRLKQGFDAVERSPEPRAVLKRFDDSSIVFELQFWVHDPSRRRARKAQTAAIAAVKDAFEREGIVIPFPQRTHVARDDGGFRVEGPTSLAEGATDVSGDD